MKTRNKALVLTLCAVLLVVATVMGTLAYLTSTDEVQNTFTFGKVKISLDEAKVNPDGTPVEGADRVKENEYHLIPGHKYVKDPTVHVDPDSETSWIFVKVENGIVNFEGPRNSIRKQITEGYWNELEGHEGEGIYYLAYTKGSGNITLPVFEEFTIADVVTDLSGAEDATVKVTAYAIQAEGFETAAEAWAQLNP